MRLIHLMVAAALFSTSAAAGAQQAEPQPATDSATFRVFLRGAPIGSEDITVRQDESGLTIAGHGRLGSPIDLVSRQLFIRYDAQGRPIELSIDALNRGTAFTVNTTFEEGTATSEIVQGGTPSRKQDTVAPNTLVLPNLFFGSYEALARRLASIPDGSSFQAYIAPQAEITVKQNARSSRKIETAARVIDVRTYALTFQNPGAPVDATIWTDEAGRLLRFEVPSQSLLYVRSDIASVAARAVNVSRDGDLAVRIPANGFTLAGTLSKPSGTPPPKGRYPAIVLLAGSGPTDRDEVVAGIPIFGLLAAPLADAGYHVLRYDKRGIGQSGGRAESGTIEEYAEDARAAVRFLRKRKDVDPDRIVLLGHSEGALAAMLAASRDDDIAALVLVGAPSVPGGELVLEQQQYLLGRMNLTEAERTARIELQKRIQAAVVGEGSWDGIAEPLRRQADTSWFQSFLRFTPADVIAKTEQPILIIQGELDKQVMPHHADRLAEMARARKDAPKDAVEVVRLDKVNHLLVQATTGNIEEYSSLTGQNVDPRVASATIEWLGRVLPRPK
ncbi:MAG TPA: alpha/beta fold hydrolase [Vicinamibacterales bacterium]